MHVLAMELSMVASGFCVRSLEFCVTIADIWLLAFSAQKCFVVMIGVALVMSVSIAILRLRFKAILAQAPPLYCNCVIAVLRHRCLTSS